MSATAETTITTNDTSSTGQNRRGGFASSNRQRRRPRIPDAGDGVIGEQAASGPSRSQIRGGFRGRDNARGRGGRGGQGGRGGRGGGNPHVAFPHVTNNGQDTDVGAGFPSEQTPSQTRTEEVIIGSRDSSIASGSTRRKPRSDQSAKPKRRAGADATVKDGSDASARNRKDDEQRDGEKPGEDTRLRQRRPNRRGRFNANLTEAPTQQPENDGSTSQRPSEKYSMSASKKDDLTSTLIHDLSTPPYSDCPICFNSIHPAQPSWSCSPSSSVFADKSEDDGENENAQCCWTTFHLKCIRSWASKSVKDFAEAWRARGEERKGEWRCPGCQSRRTAVPTVYRCFCGSTVEPKLARLATPHSCGNPCSRRRTCTHSCPLPCHPGPCPPCSITITIPCHCGKQILSYRCSSLNPGKGSGHGQSRNPTGSDLTCGKTCGKRLECGNHSCQDTCHPGPCAACKVTKVARCYCGKSEKELRCGEGLEKPCSVRNDEGTTEEWTGEFECEAICARPFDCGIHRCQKPCHPPSPTPPVCPFSPSVVDYCPCGKHSLSSSSASAFSPGTNLIRSKCTDPIPTCNSTCMKLLDGCDHTCSSPCHTGPCPPCSISIVRPCRCGSITRDIKCSDLRNHDNEEILCEKPCTALRACGRHQCNRLCCPLASLAGIGKGKGKKKVTSMVLEVADQAGLHECDLVCGKPLGCGNHTCEERDHKGPCPPCLRSSFEEMFCHCGRTILDPPIPCGTRINCTYPCDRPPPLCGHPKTQHACHEDPAPCPPCPFLTSKRCACGKKTVDNVKCSQERVSCGTPCGKLVGCGFHHCERLCHGDDCGPCSALCGKPRKLCLPAQHPCTQPCHAPAACPETEPCRATITVTCPCGRIRQSVPCGRSTSNPVGREGTQQLKCTNECLVAKRNARLAAALGIEPDKQDKEVSYSDELVGFARANAKFCALVEKTFGEFVSSEKKNQVLPHMPMDRRKFVYDLAAVYRMDTQMVDQEPHRSVQLIRRVDSRIPKPLLSSVAASSSAPLGKLVDLRSTQYSRATSPAHTSSSAPSTAPRRGWTSIVSNAPSAASPAGTAWSSAKDGNGGGHAQPSPAVRTSVAPPWLRQSEVNVRDASEHVPDNWEEDV